MATTVIYACQPVGGLDRGRRQCGQHRYHLLAGDRRPAGLVYPLKDRHALAAALKRIAGSVELRRDLSEKASARVRQAYDWETIADQTLAVYERTIGRPASG